MLNLLVKNKYGHMKEQDVENGKYILLIETGEGGPLY
jgi:hypothetical protein